MEGKKKASCRLWSHPNHSAEAFERNPVCGALAFGNAAASCSDQIPRGREGPEFPPLSRQDAAVKLVKLFLSSHLPVADVKACSISAMMSSTCSMPMDRRT
jgi:hypothetical protein